MAAVAEAAKPTSGVRALLMRRKGPLPLWAWIGGLLVTVLAIMYWRNRKNAQTADANAVDVAPGDQSAPPIFVVPQQPAPTVTVPITVQPPGPPTGTVPTAPPGAGRPNPPGSAGVWVTVKDWTRKNAPWESMISTIASHYHVPDWHTVWNAPENADLRKKRNNNPKLIRKGDRVFVPGAK